MKPTSSTCWRAAGPQKWFKKDAAFDADIRSRFLASYEAAVAGRLADWEASPGDALSLIAAARGLDIKTQFGAVLEQAAEIAGTESPRCEIRKPERPALSSSRLTCPVMNTAGTESK